MITFTWAETTQIMGWNRSMTHTKFAGLVITEDVIEEELSRQQKNIEAKLSIVHDRFARLSSAVFDKEMEAA